MSIKTTRRNFIQSSAVIGALAAATGTASFGGNIFRALADDETNKATDDVWLPTTCLACAAHNKCGLLAHRVNGVLVKLEGNPEDPSNQGANCAKSNAAIASLYNPYRVKYPVKRTNPEKGPGVDPKWVQISWEEAYSTIVEKLKKVKADNPAKFVYMSGHGGSLDNESDAPFIATFGSPNLTFGGTLGGCAGGSSAINDWIHGHNHARADKLYCKYFLNFGNSSEQGAKGNSEEVYNYIQGRANGLKVINIAPLISPHQAQSDEWIPIIPGMAGALLLSMIYTILYEIKVYDTDYLKKRTNAPYLIGEDGNYIRSSDALIDDPIRKQKLGKPLVWDAAENKAKVYDDPSVKDFALEGSYTVNGKTCCTAFEMLKERVKEYTPEKMSTPMDIPAATIRRLAKEWVDNAQIGSTITIDGVNFPYRPVAVSIEQGAKCHVDDYHVVMASKILSILVGATDCPGSEKAATAPVMTPNPADGINMPNPSIRYNPISQKKLTLGDVNPTGQSSPMFYKAAMDPKAYNIPYEIEVFGFHGGNPQALLADPNLIASLFKKIPFIFAISLEFDEPTEQADIVLPESSWLERHGILEVTPHSSLTNAFRKKGTGGVRLRQPVVKPLFESKEGNDIVFEIADRLGILTGDKGLLNALNKSLGLKPPFLMDANRKYSWAEVTDLRLKTIAGDGKGLDWFKKNNGAFYTKAYPVQQYYGATKYPNIRVPIYLEEWNVFRGYLNEELSTKGITLKPSNDFMLSYLSPVPYWHPHPEHLVTDTEMDLYCINYKNMQHHYGTQNAWAMELTEAQDPYSMNVVMNAETAAQKGLKDGDRVEIESFVGGKVQGVIKTSQCIHPKVTAIGGCFGHRSININPTALKGPNFNALLKLSDELMDPLATNIDRDVKVKIRRI